MLKPKNRQAQTPHHAQDMNYFKTQYEKFYDTDAYYWGTEPASFLPGLIAYADRDPHELRVLDIGCGEGKDAVFMAQQGCTVSAFDITVSGIRKTNALAAARGVSVNAWTDDINTFTAEGPFDIIYSTGTIQYLAPENIAPFFEKVKSLTAPGGIVHFNVFVDKPFLELPPDWDVNERMWRSGDLFTAFADWELLRIDEEIFEDNSNGIPHFHCMDVVTARRRG